MEHDFQTSLRRSFHYQDAYWWEVVYKQAFPTLAGMQDVRQNGWAQQAGIDRVLLLADSSRITVDEKVREKDYGDIALEVWSDHQRRKDGWTKKPLAIDYLAYAVVPSATVYLLPFRLLQLAYKANETKWRQAVVDQRPGYFVKDARNRGYVTRNLCLPLDDLLDAMKNCMTFSWGITAPEAEATVVRIADLGASA